MGLRQFLGALTAFALAAAVGDISSALAHGGGLDANGCHHDRKRGGYHCHRAPSASRLIAPTPGSKPVRKRRRPTSVTVKRRVKPTQPFVPLLSTSTPATGQQPSYVSSEGHQYLKTCNANGFKLTSQFPVARTIGAGAATEYVTDTETLLLGKSCDAYSETFKQGTWCWANGGFRVGFLEKEIGFPRQELSCAGRDGLGDACTCP
jgi:hypothetical protein